MREELMRQMKDNESRKNKAKRDDDQYGQKLSLMANTM